MNPLVPTRRIAFTPAVLHAALLLALSCGAVQGASAAHMKIVKSADIPLTGSIESRPVVLRGPQAGALSVAVVTLETVKDRDHYSAVEAYQLDGKHLRGFPALRRKMPFAIAPADQLAAVDVDHDGVDEILAMDTDGAPHYLRLAPHRLRLERSQIRTQAEARPEHGVLAWPPTSLAIPDKPGWLLLSLQLGMIADSQARLGLVNAAGQPYPGFPVSFFGSPERIAPIVLAQEDRIFVWLNQGTVDGFAISSGQRLPGFPTATIGESVASGHRRMVYSAAAKRIFVSTSSNSLASVDPMTGKVESTTVPGARTLTGLVSTATHLYAYDEGTHTLLALDAKGKKISQLKLDIAEGSKLSSMQAQSASGETGVFLVFSNSGRDGESKVNALYEQYAPADYKKKVQAAVAEDVSMSFDKVDKTDPLQIEHARTRTQELKRGYLEDRFGGIALASLIFGPESSQAIAVSDSQGNMQVVLNDSIQDLRPEGNFEGYDPRTVFSTLYEDAASHSSYWLVPLNNEKKKTATIRVYQIRY